MKHPFQYDELLDHTTAEAYWPASKRHMHNQPSEQNPWGVQGKE